MTGATEAALCDIDPRQRADLEDPHQQPAYLHAVAAATGRRAVEVRCAGQGWSLTYPLFLTPVSDGRWLARTPDYGGPWLEAQNPEVAATESRRAVDRVLRDNGVISEVTLTSPWLPHVQALASSWGLRPTKAVCVWPLPPDVDELSHGRRADLRKATGAVSFSLLTEATADAFAAQYAQAMARVAAEDRWVLDQQYFRCLAGSGLVHVAEADGAMALFLVWRQRAVYLFSVRWGGVPGASTQVLWTGAVALARLGAREMLLGGGVGSSDDDPLLRFKRSWGARQVSQLLGARCFDVAAQERLEAGGFRRLPEWWTAG